MNKHVTATFKTPSAAREAIERLADAGFTQDDISVLVTDSTRGQAFALKEGTKADEYSAVGAGAGGAFGAIAALLMSAAVIPTGGLGLVAIGPLFATLAGLGAGGLAGGLVGGLTGAGISEHEAKIYEDDLKDGKILIAIKTEDADEEKEGAGYTRALRLHKNCGLKTFRPSIKKSPPFGRGFLLGFAGFPEGVEYTSTQNEYRYAKG